MAQMISFGQRSIFQDFLSGIPARDYVFQQTPYTEQISQAAKLIEEADYILVGAGAGLSTAAFNLPSRYVLHTVGPIIYGRVTGKDRELLGED